MQMFINRLFFARCATSEVRLVFRVEVNEVGKGRKLDA